MANEVQAQKVALAVPAYHARSVKSLAFALAAVVACSLAMTLFPAWVIRPFRPQGEGELTIALALLRFAPVVTILTGVLGLWLAWNLWSRRRLRAAALVAVLLLGASAWLARTDYFEFMFRPDPSPRVWKISQAALEPDDMVLVVRQGGDARAYPIRMMAYHHLVNDTVAGVALLPTY
jgi:uncharacterized protein DUF3179